MRWRECVHASFRAVLREESPQTGCAIWVWRCFASTLSMTSSDNRWIRPMKSTFKLCAVAVLSSLCALGCNSKKEIKVLPPPAPPPSYPAKQSVPMDASLHEAATRQVLTSVQAPDPIERANALEAVQDGMGAAGAQYILAALNDPQPVVRFSACMATGKLRLSEAQPK